MIMKKYCKPSCVSHNTINGIAPLAAVASAIGVQAVTSVATAALVGAAAGLALGGKDYLPMNNKTLKEQMGY